MSPIRIVLDTNVLLRCVSRRSEYKILLDKLYQGNYELYVSHEILLEYEEKISEDFLQKPLN